MPETLLQTKLTIPPQRPKLVPRPHLIKRLNQGQQQGCKLTLVSAPAGFGKTTLVLDWVHSSQMASHETRFAWLSLDEDDNDLARFLAYFVAALQSVETGLGVEAKTILQSTQLPPTDSILATLINAISASSRKIVLILDDYHLIETRPIHEALTFLLEHMPPQMHLVIATRSNPPFPTARFRGRGQISELRAADLRFTSEEAASFLNEIMGLDLSEPQIGTLKTRTEGWIAGLQLAAVSMRGIDETASFLSSFSGDHHYIVDYLVDEVLDQCSDPTREFLLQTSILERMSGSLCDAVTREEGSQDLLEELEQSNLFIVPLDHRRWWYRYHHLFVELLRHRLDQTHTDQIAGLHHRASVWFEENDFSREAVRHALALTDLTRAADLIEGYSLSLLSQSQTKTMLSWFKALPDDLIASRPMLCVFYAWALTLDEPATAHDATERLLSQADQAMDTLRADPVFRNLVAGHAISIRAFYLQPPVQSSHDPYVVLADLQRAQELLPESEASIRSINAVNINYEYLVLGDTKAAFAATVEALSAAQVGDNHFVSVFSICSQALIAYYRGQLNQALKICRLGITSFDVLNERLGQTIPAIGGLYAMLGYFLLEQNQIPEAESALVKGIDLLQWIGEYEALALAHIALVRLRLIQGEYEDAQHTIERLENTWPACASLAETLRMQQRLTQLVKNPTVLDTALRWVQSHQPELRNDKNIPGINPWGETLHLEHLTWAQVQIAQARLKPLASRKPYIQPVLEYLERRLDVAGQRDLIFRVIELSVMQALALDAMGDVDRATASLQRALTLAETGEYVRVFTDKGASVARLLMSVSDGGRIPSYAGKMLVVYENQGVVGDRALNLRLVESLSERELEVLRLIAAGRSNREIAQELTLAVGTVKKHINNIFGKLHVHSRTQAVAQARELKLM